MNEKQFERPGQPGTEISVLDTVNLLLRKWYWLALAGLLLGLGVYLIVTFLVTPTYESRVSFYVYNTSDSASHSGTVNNNDLQAAESLATTYSKILGSNSVLDAILSDLGTQALTRKELAEMVEASVIKDTQLLEVVVTSTDAAFACDVARSFAKVAPTEIVRITKAGGVEVVDRPELPTEKASPRTVFDTAVGVMVGLLVAAVVIIVRTLSDTTIYLPGDVTNRVGVTVLGQIPEIASPDDGYTYWTLEKGGVIRDEIAQTEARQRQ